METENIMMDAVKAGSSVSTLPIRNGNYSTLLGLVTDRHLIVSTLPIRNGNTSN